MRNLALAMTVLGLAAGAPTLGHATASKAGTVDAALSPSVSARPVPQTAPAAANPIFTVHFDNDISGFDAVAMARIDAAARYILAGGPVRVLVSGHTDTAGSDASNQRISMARARAVADRLILLGVRVANVELMAYGETRPAVPTADNVAEPQNRRVEIRIGPLD